MNQIAITVPETACWHALIGKAEFHAQYVLPNDVEDYLIRLFMRYEQQSCLFTTDTNKSKQPESSLNKLQQLGDQCLMLCGFYPEASKEYGVAIEEFISMGRDAYKKLASSQDDESEILFECLAKNFEQIADMLFYINDVSNKSVKNNPDIDSDHYIEDMTTSFTFQCIEQPSFQKSLSRRSLN